MITQDQLWKASFEDFPEESIEYFLPELFGLVDWSLGFEFLDKELAQIFPESEEQPRRVDLLMKFWLHGGQEQWVLLHIEAQGYVDRDFGRRMFTYFYRLTDRYNVPVATFALLTDPNRKWFPEFYKFDFCGTRCTHEFPFLKLAAMKSADFERLKHNSWTILLKNAQLALRRKWSDESLLAAKLNIYREMLSLGRTPKQIRSFFRFIKYYVRFGTPDFFNNFDTEIQIIHQKEHRPMGIVELTDQLILEMGIEQGIEKGIEKGKAEGIDIGIEIAVEKMLKKGFSAEQVAETLEFPLEEILVIQSKIKARDN